jgi:hypothetical protein
MHRTQRREYPLRRVSMVMTRALLVSVDEDCVHRRDDSRCRVRWRWEGVLYSTVVQCLSRGSLERCGHSHVVGSGASDEILQRSADHPRISDLLTTVKIRPHSLDAVSVQRESVIYSLRGDPRPVPIPDSYPIRILKTGKHASSSRIEWLAVGRSRVGANGAAAPPYREVSGL